MTIIYKINIFILQYVIINLIKIKEHKKNILKLWGLFVLFVLFFTVGFSLFFVLGILPKIFGGILILVSAFISILSCEGLKKLTEINPVLMRSTFLFGFIIALLVGILLRQSLFWNIFSFLFLFYMVIFLLMANSYLQIKR